MRKKLPYCFFTRHRVRSFAPLFFLLALTSLKVQAQQAELIKDVNQKEELLHDEYTTLHPAVGILYFLSRNTELWKTTGSSAGTVRLKTFKNIRNLQHIGGTAYFIADDGKSGQELWK